MSRESMELNRIEHLKQKGKAEKLEGFTNDKDPVVRAAAYEALGSITKEESANILVAGIADEDAKVRLAVAKALGKVGTAHNAESLRHQMTKEADPEVLEALREAAAAAKDRR